MTEITGVPTGSFEVGDEIVLTRDVPKPRWWQLRKLFCYYILRRRISKDKHRVTSIDGYTLTLDSPLAGDGHDDVTLTALD